jgi:hypothetical protein
MNGPPVEGLIAHFMTIVRHCSPLARRQANEWREANGAALKLFGQEIHADPRKSPECDSVMRSNRSIFLGRSHQTQIEDG